MELSLRYYGDPILRERAPRVDVFDEALREIASAMIVVMHREKGIGLAAPQVGLSMRLIVALTMKDPEDTSADPLVLVNPEVLERSPETWKLEEGCLSLPGIGGEVVRAENITVRYHDVNGVENTVVAEGMFARVLLHEIDHLEGRLFIDYLSAAAKTLLKPRLRQITEQYSG